MKAKANKISNSPCRSIKKIELASKNLGLSFPKHQTFLKAYRIKTSLAEQSCSGHFENDSYAVSKRCEADTFSSKEINDLCTYSLMQTIEALSSSPLSSSPNSGTTQISRKAQSNSFREITKLLVKCLGHILILRNMPN
jgi:hypothetical protein